MYFLDFINWIKMFIPFYNTDSVYKFVGVVPNGSGILPGIPGYQVTEKTGEAV